MADEAPSKPSSLGGISLSAALGLMVGVMAGVNFVDKSSREEADQNGKLGTHAEKLKNLKDDAWYAKGEREALRSRVEALEKTVMKISPNQQLTR